MQRTSTYIGTTPSGVEWLCYRNPSDTDVEYTSRVEQMRDAFAALERRAGHV